MVNNRLYVGFGYRNALGNEDFDPQYNDLSAYDPDTDSWERKASFPSERDGIIAFAVNNYIFAGGGTYRDFSEPSIDHQDFWKYDPVSDQWTQLKDLPQGHRKKGTGFGLLNKGYWINETEFWEYLPDSDEWKEKSYPLPSGQGLRYDFTINGKAYLRAGGTFWEYDPLGESWTERTNGPSGESFAIDDIGYRLSGQVWAYYPLIECE